MQPLTFEDNYASSKLHLKSKHSQPLLSLRAESIRFPPNVFTILVIRVLCSAGQHCMPSDQLDTTAQFKSDLFTSNSSEVDVLTPNQHHHKITLILFLARRKKVKQRGAMHEYSLLIYMQCETYLGDGLWLRSAQ